MANSFWNSISVSKGSHFSSKEMYSPVSSNSRSHHAYSHTKDSLSKKDKLKDKLFCSQYKANNNMWCSVNPCDNCFEYSKKNPQWCFAGSIRTHQDKGKQCDLTDIANTPICRGCLVKMGIRNGWFGSSASVTDFFVPTKDNFNYLYTVKINRSESSTTVFFWGFIQKNINDQTYTAYKLDFEESRRIVYSMNSLNPNSKRVFTAPFGLVTQVDPALRSSKMIAVQSPSVDSAIAVQSPSVATVPSELDPAIRSPVTPAITSSPVSTSVLTSVTDPLTPETLYSPVQYQSIDCDNTDVIADNTEGISEIEGMSHFDELEEELYKEKLTPDQLREYEHYEDGSADEAIEELKKIGSVDEVCCVLEEKGAFELAKIYGQRYLDINEHESIDLWGSDVNPFPSSKSLIETVEALPDSMVRTAVAKGLISRLLMVIA